MTYDFLLTDPEGRLLNLQHDNSFHNNAPEYHKGNPTPHSNRRRSKAMVKEKKKSKYSLEKKESGKKLLNLSAVWLSLVRCNNYGEIIIIKQYLKI